jgi:hypothetical protein
LKFKIAFAEDASFGEPSAFYPRGFNGENKELFVVQASACN